MRTKELFYLLATCLTTTYSCIDEDIYPCPPNGVRLQYDYLLNMNYANEFGKQVKDLKTFIFDKEGVLQDTLAPQVIAGELTDSWSRDIELSPGNYTLVTWANHLPLQKHFRITSVNDSQTEGVTIGKTKLSELRAFLRCDILPTNNDQATPQYKEFSDLFYGIAQNVEVKSREMTPVHTSLIKDTKTIRVKVKNISAISKPAPSTEQFTFRLTGRNGHYKSDNLTGEPSLLLTYTPFFTAIDKDTLQADIRTLRLLPHDPSNSYSTPLQLEVRCGKVTFCQELDVVDLILKSKIPSRDANGQIKKDSSGEIIWVYPTREYLDRQDLFEIVFECSGGDPGPDPNPNLVITIYVNGWKIQNMTPDLTA